MEDRPAREPCEMPATADCSTKNSLIQLGLAAAGVAPPMKILPEGPWMAPVLRREPRDYDSKGCSPRVPRKLRPCVALGRRACSPLPDSSGPFPIRDACANRSPDYRHDYDWTSLRVSSTENITLLSLRNLDGKRNERFVCSLGHVDRHRSIMSIMKRRTNRGAR